MTQQKSERINPYLAIFEQYVEEASFLWLLRSVALKQPHYTPVDLRRLESRIEAHLEGLLGSPEESWELCQRALLYEEPGEVFTASVVAFKSLEAAKIQSVVEAACVNPNAMKGLTSALAYLPLRLVQEWLKKFIQSKDLRHKHIAITVYSARRMDPGAYLERILLRDDCRNEVRLYARSLRLVGELKREDLKSYLDYALESEDEAIRFWALWSSVLLGERQLLTELESFLVKPGDLCERALSILFRAAPGRLVKELITKMTKSSELLRTVIQAIGIYGDPQAVPWLIQHMSTPQFARVAGESFTTITGIDLEEKALAMELPEELDTLFDVNDDNISLELDADENLPWPDAGKIKAIWHKYGGKFNSGQRYFLGKPVNADTMRRQVLEGKQRHRAAAAVELALLTDAKIPNTSAWTS